MKTKNLSLAVIAFTFAIGSAFASMFAASDIIVKGRAVNDPDSPIVCYNTHKQCEATGNATCQVTVTLSGGGTQLASTSSSTAGTYQADCTTILKTQTTASQTDAIVGSRPAVLVP